MWELQCLLLATGSVYDRVFSVSLRRSWSQSVEGGSSTVQLHSTQLLRILTWGADEDRCHFLAKLPPGEALWWKLCLLLSPLLRLPVCPCQGHEEIPWGKYQHVNNSETFTYTYTFSITEVLDYKIILKLRADITERTRTDRKYWNFFSKDYGLIFKLGPSMDQFINFKI